MPIQPKTKTEQDLYEIDVEESSVGLAISALIAAVNNTYWKLWNLPDDRLLAVLNALGPIEVQALFERHRSKGQMLNTLAESENVTARVIIGSARDVEWSDGAFRMVPKAIEPDPEQP